jgi:hypothetical protein
MTHMPGMAATTVAALLLDWTAVAVLAQEARGSKSQSRELARIQVAALAYFVAKECSHSGSYYPGGCLVSAARKPISTDVLASLKDLGIVGVPEAEDFDIGGDGLSVGYMKKQALIVNVHRVVRKGTAVAEAQVETYASVIDATVCSLLVRRAANGDWTVDQETVRCTA